MPRHLEINEFRNRFFELTRYFTWEIQGFIDQNDNVFPIDSDTKVLSTVFERFASPALRSLAAENDYVVENANQTTYPDFTLTKYDLFDNVEHRIAIDIKSTYIEPTSRDRGKFKSTKMTLGSYNSFIRNNTKNILHPYSTYHEHWVLGFVYTRNEAFEEYTLENIPARGQIRCPYSVKSVFIREKVDLTGIRAGSGNTKNIGSVTINEPNGFEYIDGPFTRFRDKKGACDLYWAEYETLQIEIYDWDTLYTHQSMEQFK
jgi:hypothetical protein